MNLFTLHNKMKKQLLFLFSILVFKCSFGQTLQPIQLEIYDPFSVQVFRTASCTSDNLGNTFVSISDGSSFSGVVKLNTAGNVIWQKKLSSMLTPVDRGTKTDQQNLLYKPSDGVYVATKGAPCSACFTSERYLSKCNANTGTFFWHLKYSATDDEGTSNSIVLNAPNGIYWIHGQHVFNISASGTILFEKKLYRTIHTATVLADGSLYLGCYDYTLGASIVRLDNLGNVVNAFNLSLMFTPRKMEYYGGHLYISLFDVYSNTQLVKMDSLGTVSGSIDWRMFPGGFTMWSGGVGGNWIIYKNKIIFSHGSKAGPIESFVKLNSFTVFDMNLNPLETFCFPHYATYDLSAINDMGPYPGSPEAMNINNGFLQIIGNKGDSNFKNGSLLRIDSTLTFKGCGKIVDTLTNLNMMAPISVVADTINSFSSSSIVSTIFPSNTTMPFLVRRNDLLIDSIPTTSIYCGECSSSALGYTSGDAAVVYYNWGVETGGQTGNPATNLCPGNYHLVVSDNYGCKDSSAFEIVTSPPVNMNLCVSTVDTTSSYNILAWEKPVSTTLAGFNIYKEITTSNFQLIDFVAYDSLSEYNDSLANPNVTNYRYKIAAVDTCGYESALSDFHSTIHLQILGSGNLQWTLYDIENQTNPVSFYNIYRDNLSDGTWTLLTGSLPGTNSTYTDINYATYPLASYRVDVNWGISCTPTRASINTTRSNIKNKSVTAAGITSAELDASITVFPNPASDFVTIELAAIINNANLEIFNTLGQKVFAETIESNPGSKTAKQIDLADLAKGVYTIAIDSKGTKVFKKLVVN